MYEMRLKNRWAYRAWSIAKFEYRRLRDIEGNLTVYISMTSDCKYVAQTWWNPTGNVKTVPKTWTSMQNNVADVPEGQRSANIS